MTAFASDHGSRAAAGALLAAVGGGQRLRRPDLRRARARVGAGAALGAHRRGLSRCARCHCSLAPSIAVMAPLAVVAGLCLAPYMAAANQLVGDVAPPGAVTEAFAWPITAIALGAAGGSAAAGAIAQSVGWREGFAAVVAAGLVAGTVAVAGRRTVGA